MAFTPERLTATLQITDDQANQIIGLIRGLIDPATVPAVATWIDQCWHRPARVALVMRAIDSVLETHGTEAVWGTGSELQPVAEYCNTGETYAATIFYDYMANKYRLTTLGDFVEQYEWAYKIR